MCLFVKHDRRPSKTRTVYKVLKLSSDRKYLVAPIIAGFTYKPGNIVAKGKPKRKISDWDGTEIIEGGVLHALKSRRAAKELRNSCSRLVIVKLTGKPKHYVATGTESEICYTQLFLSKEEHKRAMKKVLKQVS